MAGIILLTTSCLLMAVVGASQSEDIHTTKVFIMTIGPWFFNWTDPKNLNMGNQFSYRPSLLNAPDLPSWMFYTCSERHNRGFVYGAPPKHQRDLQLEVVGLNKQNYEARRRVIKMNVVEKNEPALYEVRLKVDKLNVEDMLESGRYNHLLDVFRRTLWPDSQQDLYIILIILYVGIEPALYKVRLKVDKLNVEDMLESGRYNHLLDVFRRTLWPDSQQDLYITFLASAVHLGARLPLNPTEGEGVVIHIGSRAPFSQTLLDLQKEVSPLQSKGQTNCPDFKHTSVERFFKQYNFSLDWCAFSLSEGQSKGEETAGNIPDIGTHFTHLWRPIGKEELPTRNYLLELAGVSIILLFCFIVMVGMLTLIMCFKQDTVIQNASEAIINSISVMFDGLLRIRNDDTPQSLLVQYEAVHRASSTLRSRSMQRDTSPRLSMERGGLRPNPPPYTGVHHSTRKEYLEDDDAKTWYC